MEVVHRPRLRRSAQINLCLARRGTSIASVEDWAGASVERHVAASLAVFEFVEDRIMRYTFTPAFVLAIVGVWLLASPSDRALGQANTASGQSAAASAGNTPGAARSQNAAAALGQQNAASQANRNMAQSVNPNAAQRANQNRSAQANANRNRANRTQAGQDARNRTAPCRGTPSKTSRCTSG
jgi:hypothetical protein